MTRVLVLVILLAAPACTKTRECDRLVKLVNPGLLEVAAARAAAPAPTRGLRDAADRYDVLAADLEKLPIRTERLARAVTDYAQFFRRTAVSTRSAAISAEQESAAALASAQRDLGRAVVQEKLLVARTNGVCQSP